MRGGGEGEGEREGGREERDYIYRERGRDERYIERDESEVWERGK